MVAILNAAYVASPCRHQDVLTATCSNSSTLEGSKTQRAYTVNT
jgi:hypothetical protein